MANFPKLESRFLRAFWRDRLSLLLIGLNAAVNLGTWWILLRVTEGETSLVPIHYTISIGIDRIGSPSELFLAPGLGAGVFIVNTMLAWLTFREARLSRFLLAATLGLEIIIAVSVGFLVIQFL